MLDLFNSVVGLYSHITSINSINRWYTSGMVALLDVFMVAAQKITFYKLGIWLFFKSNHQ